MGYVGTKPTAAPLTSAQLEDGLVTAAKLATDAVETAKVKDLNVTVAKLPATVDVSSKTVTLPASVMFNRIFQIQDNLYISKQS